MACRHDNYDPKSGPPEDQLALCDCGLSWKDGHAAWCSSVLLERNCGDCWRRFASHQAELLELAHDYIEDTDAPRFKMESWLEDVKIALEVKSGSR